MTRRARVHIGQPTLARRAIVQAAIGACRVTPAGALILGEAGVVVASVSTTPCATPSIDLIQSPVVMRKWLVAGATAAALFCSAGAAPASLVKVDLVVDGEVVSARTTAQLGLYGPDAKQDNPTLKCVFGQICSVPAGTYQMDVVADDLILVRRPTMHVDASEEGDRINSARLEAVRSAWIVADLPTQDGYRLDVVDISSGGVFHGLFGPERSRLKVPARKLVGALRDGSRHLGLFRLAPKAGEVVRLQPPPSPAKGRGQLLCSFDFPEPSGPPGYTQLSPTLVQGEQERPPDIVVTGSPMHVWAIWFDVPAG